MLDLIDVLDALGEDRPARDGSCVNIKKQREHRDRESKLPQEKARGGSLVRWFAGSQHKILSNVDRRRPMAVRFVILTDKGHKEYAKELHDYPLLFTSDGWCGKIWLMLIASFSL